MNILRALSPILRHQSEGRQHDSGTRRIHRADGGWRMHGTYAMLTIIVVNSLCFCALGAARDSASDPDYANGWLAGTNGGFGFGPWAFNNFFDPQFSPYPTAQFIAENSYVDIPSGGPAFGETNGNQPFWGYTSRALRPFSTPLQVGGNVAIDLDNPILAPLNVYDTSGVIYQLLDSSGNQQLGLLGQSDLNAADWTLYDGDHPNGLDTGLPLSTTAKGVHISVTLTDTQSYQLVLTPLSTGIASTFSGHLLEPGTPVGSLQFVMYGNGSSATGSRELYANNLQITSPANPDVNHDGIVNSQDLALISSNWLQLGSNVTGDANGDGIVNAQDLALVSSDWLHTSSGATATGLAVPEPASFFLLLFGATCLAAVLLRSGVSKKWHHNRCHWVTEAIDGTDNKLD